MPEIINNDALATYVAASVALVVMISFFWYLWTIDRGVAELRRRLDARPTSQEQSAAPLRPRRRVAREDEDGNTGS